jgi:hypothetical protein
MSLINDALKRARQAQQKHSPPPAPGASLRPVDAARPKGPSSGLVWLVTGALVLGLGAMILILTAIRGSAAKDKELASTPTKPAAKVTAATNVPPPAPKPVSPSVNTAQPVASAPRPSLTVAGQVAPPGAASVSNAVMTAMPAAPPALPKLQGIFYRPDRPSALLNGKTILVGGSSGEFQVVAITQQSVTVARAGRTNVLSLPE